MRGEMQTAKGVLSTLRKEMDALSIHADAATARKGKAEDVTAGKGKVEDVAISADAVRKSLYAAWSNIVVFYFNTSHIIEAVDEVRQMQDFASSTNDEYGMACVAETYGGIYTYNFEESIRNLRRALDYWEQTDNRPKIQYTYYMLAREALGMAQYTDSAAIRQQMFIDVLVYADKIESLSSTIDYYTQISEYLRAMVYLEEGDKAKARTSFDRISAWWRAEQTDPKIKGAMAFVMAKYLIMYSNPDLAVSLIPLISPTHTRLETERLFCLQKGDHSRLIELQKELERIYNRRTTQLQQLQLAIANSAYNNLRLVREKHQLEMDSARRTQMFNIVVVIALALIVVIIAMIIYHRRILLKNRALVNHIQAYEESEKKSQTLAMSMAESLSQEEQLFLRIEQLLEQNIAILTDAELDRESLAAHLGTNRTYVAQAISFCTNGNSVSEYINRLRLQYAHRLLATQPEMSIDCIATASGFGSRSRFHHLFVIEYGMTPAQFRKAAKARD